MSKLKYKFQLDKKAQEREGYVKDLLSNKLGEPLDGQSALVSLSGKAAEVGISMQKNAAEWMATQLVGKGDSEELRKTAKRIEQEWTLLGEKRGPALAALNLELENEKTVSRLNHLVKCGATVSELASYALAPKGDILIDGDSQENQIRKIENRIYEAQNRKLNEKSVTIGLFTAVPSVVFGVGVAALTFSMAVPMLGIEGTAQFLSPVLTVGAGTVSGLGALRGIRSAISVKNKYDELRRNPPKIEVISTNDPDKGSERVRILNESLSRIPYADRHLLKHFDANDMQVFLLGNDEIRRKMFENKPPSQKARMEADIAGMYKLDARGVFQFLKANIDPGIKSSAPGSLNGGIDKLEERLTRWRDSKTNVELPGRNPIRPM